MLFNYLFELLSYGSGAKLTLVSSCPYLHPHYIHITLTQTLFSNYLSIIYCLKYLLYIQYFMLYLNPKPLMSNIRKINVCFSFPFRFTIYLLSILHLVLYHIPKFVISRRDNEYIFNSLQCITFVFKLPFCLSISLDPNYITTSIRSVINGFYFYRIRTSWWCYTSIITHYLQWLQIKT